MKRQNPPVKYQQTPMPMPQLAQTQSPVYFWGAALATQTSQAVHYVVPEWETNNLANTDGTSPVGETQDSTNI